MFALARPRRAQVALCYQQFSTKNAKKTAGKVQNSRFPEAYRKFMTPPCVRKTWKRIIFCIFETQTFFFYIELDSD